MPSTMRMWMPMYEIHLDPFFWNWHLMTRHAIRGHQRSSEVIRGHQNSLFERSSEVIRGHQRPSEQPSERSSVTPPLLLFFNP